MKKIIFLFALIALSLTASAQTTTLLSAVTATTSITGVITTNQRVQIISIQTYTSSTYAGTTATMTLKGSNDGINWSTMYADDNVTALSCTLTTGVSTCDWIIKSAVYKYYLVIYTKGNASAGTVTTTVNQQ